MPYALIPDGYKLRKVNAAQQKALKDKQRHENVTEILKNPATVPIVAGALTAVVGGILIDRFIDNLGITIDGSVEKAKKSALQMGAPFTKNPLTGAWPDLDVDLGELIGKLIPDTKDLKDLKIKGLA
jgi:hypothetical protein